MVPDRSVVRDARGCARVDPASQHDYLSVTGDPKRDRSPFRCGRRALSRHPTWRRAGLRPYLKPTYSRRRQDEIRPPHPLPAAGGNDSAAQEPPDHVARAGRHPGWAAHPADRRGRLRVGFRAGRRDRPPARADFLGTFRRLRPAGRPPGPLSAGPGGRLSLAR